MAPAAQILFCLSVASIAAAQCSLELPPNPLTATGLSTPFKLSGCNQIDFANQGVFVEATIVDPSTGSVTVYHPLIINNGNGQNIGTSFITPVVPTVPSNAAVGLWFGTNANTLTLTGTTQGCVNGLNGDLFGQFAYCNAAAVFSAAQSAVAAGRLTIPAPGSTTKAATQQACLAGTRDFRMVDMDQSDNVVTTYLLIDGKKLAQNTPANAKANSNSTELTNGSDNALLNDFLQPVLGCSTFQVPSLTAPTGMSSSLVLNELVSLFHPPQNPALVPLNDPMVRLASGTQSLAKTNLYRAGVGQTSAQSNGDADGTTYCKQFAASGIFIAENQKLFSQSTSPAPGTANNLFTFMANRFATSFGPSPALGCVTFFGLQNSPVTQQTDGNGVVTAAVINTAVLQSILGTPSATSTRSTSTSRTTAASKTKAASAKFRAAS